MAQPPQDWQGWNPLCQLHQESIDALKVQQAFTSGALLERLQDIKDIQAVVTNGLQGDVTRLTNAVFGTDEEPGIEKIVKRIDGVLHDLSAAWRYTFVVLRAVVASIPVLLILYGIIKFVGTP